MPPPPVGAIRLLRVWLAVVGMSAGIIWGDGHPAEVTGAALCVVGILVLGCRRNTAAVLVGILMATLGAGAVDASLRSGRRSAAALLSSDFANCEITGVVLEDQGALGTLVAVKRADCRGFAPIEDPGTVISPTKVADAGSLVSASGSFVPLQDDPFDLSRRRAGAAALFDGTWQRTGNIGSLPLRLAAAIRHGLQEATTTLGPPRQGLVRGLTIGDTRQLDPAIVDNFRRAGLSHLLAVSGENLAMFLGALALLVRRLPHRLRLVSYLAAISLFVLVVGPQPSVLRAAVMGAVMVAAVGGGHRTQPLAVLGTALIIVMAFRPGLVFSVGLQLSAAATAGIVLWTKPLERLLRPLPRVLALPLAVTMSAQAAASLFDLTAKPASIAFLAVAEPSRSAIATSLTPLSRKFCAWA